MRSFDRIGRSDFKEGGFIPYGFHWGNINSWGGGSTETRVESYIALHIKFKNKTFLAFGAWGYSSPRGYSYFYDNERKDRLYE